MLSIYFNFCNMPMSVTMERDKNRLKLTFSILFRFASYSQKLKKKNAAKMPKITICHVTQLRQELEPNGNEMPYEMQLETKM